MLLTAIHHHALVIFLSLLIFADAFHSPKLCSKNAAESSAATHGTYQSLTRTYNGLFNNPAFPHHGAEGAEFHRTTQARYADGFYTIAEGLPHAEDIADQIYENPLSSSNKTNALFAFFGHFILQDLFHMTPQCPRSVIYMKETDNEQKQYLRLKKKSASGKALNTPAQFQNEVSGYLDGSNIYGWSKRTANTLRTYKDGKVNTCEDGSCAMTDSHYFKVFHNRYAAMFRTVFLRYHNVVAEQFRAADKQLTDEQIFGRARTWTISIYQKIVYFEWFDWLLSDLASTKFPSPVSVEQSADDSPFELDKPLFTTEVFSSALTSFLFMVTPDILHSDKCTGNATCQDIYNFVWTETELMNAMGSMAMTPSLQATGGVSKLFQRVDSDVLDPLVTSIMMARDMGVPTFKKVYNVPHYRRLPFEDEFRGSPDRRDAVFRGKRDVDGSDEGHEVNSNPGNPWLRPTRFKPIQEPDFDRAGDCVGCAEIPNLYEGNATEKRNAIELVPGYFYAASRKSHYAARIMYHIIADQVNRARSGDFMWYDNRDNGLFKMDDKSCINDVTLIGLMNDLGLLTQKKPAFRLMNTKRACSHDLKCRMTNKVDVFKESLRDYLLTLVSFVVVVLACLAVILYLYRSSAVKPAAKAAVIPAAGVVVEEWQGKKGGWKQAGVDLEDQGITVYHGPQKARVLYFPTFSRRSGSMRRSSTNATRMVANISDYTVTVQTSRTVACVALRGECALVMRFETVEKRDAFISRLKGIDHIPAGSFFVTEAPLKNILINAYTIEDRQKQMNKVFRVATRAMNGETVDKALSMEANPQDVVETEITQAEFAQALRTTPSDPFAIDLFGVIDHQKTGTISFREFLDFMVIMRTGSSSEKTMLIFQLYDTDNDGMLTIAELRELLTSLMGMAKQTAAAEDVDALISQFARTSTAEVVTFEQFRSLLDSNGGDGVYQSMSWSNPKTATDGSVAGRMQKSFVKRLTTTTTLASKASNDTLHQRRQNGGEAKPEQARLTNGLTLDVDDDVQNAGSGTAADEDVAAQQKKKSMLKQYLGYYQLQFFWATVYVFVCVGIFVDRFQQVVKTDKGFIPYIGYGPALARAAAPVINFTFATMILSMCRNIWTFLRQTLLHHLIPFDSMVDFHKFCALILLFSSLVHVGAHCYNFYILSAVSPMEMNCLLPELRALNQNSTVSQFTQLGWMNITGFTGMLLVYIWLLIFLFALPIVRRLSFTIFWASHQLYVLGAALLVLHGMGFLFQTPQFYLFFVGPGILFLLDRLYSLGRRTAEIPILKAELLPSDVTNIVFKRPKWFEYQAGQWVRIACSSCASTHEYHPFTLTSSPFEEHLSLHIRAVGPWTRNLRKVAATDPLPRIFLDGPFGEGHQDWYKHDVAIMVGGGIGVTPFASIMKLVGYYAAQGSTNTLRCKKVYFFWVTRSQRQFEWLIDIIRNVETADTKDYFQAHIFITQSFEKFDLRTTLLYVCERHFQKVSNKSLFTGLRAVTHFGRPNFETMFTKLKMIHSSAKSIGVFSCGPGPMTNQVQVSCAKVNRVKGPMLTHHFENF